MSKRREFLAQVLGAMHSYYRWGGDDPETGVDCSGLVCWALWKAGGPDWRTTHNTDKLWMELPRPQTPRPGDLCLYGGKKLADGTRDPLDVSHVEVCLVDLAGSWMVVGASGGDSSTVDQITAIRQGAKVSVHRSHNYRNDFRGHRALPLDD